jgi:hypothetical protein
MEIHGIAFVTVTPLWPQGNWRNSWSGLGNSQSLTYELVNIGSRVLLKKFWVIVLHVLKLESIKCEGREECDDDINVTYCI